MWSDRKYRVQEFKKIKSYRDLQAYTDNLRDVYLKDEKAHLKNYPHHGLLQLEDLPYVLDHINSLNYSQ